MGEITSIDMKSLNPIQKGGMGRLLMLAVAFAIIAAVGLFAFNILTTWGGNIDALLGLSSALGLETEIGVTSGLTVASGSMLLGAPLYPYTSVAYSMETYDLRGDRLGTISQYVWDAEPENWGDDTTISDDYTKGAPLASSITDGDLDGTLTTASNFQYDNAGNLQLVNKRYWIHGAITGNKDIFFMLDVPNAGAFDTTSPTIQLGDTKIAKFDTTAWTSSAIDLGVDSNTEGKTLKKLTSYGTEDYNIIYVREVEVVDLNIFGDDGDLEEVTISINNCVDWTVYDYSEAVLDASYSDAGYDGKLRNSDNSPLCIITTDEYADLEIKVVADVCLQTSVAVCTYSGIGDNLYNGQTLMTVKVRDLEGNLLVNQTVTG